MLPFTHAQFIEVFGQYNTNVWPAQVVAYLLGLALVLGVLRPSANTGRWVGWGLGALWLWTAIAYHGLHFSAINKAAYVFAALFVVEAVLLSGAASSGQLRFGGSKRAAAWLGWPLIVYAFVLYPLVGFWAGSRYPEMPMFGITPCPLTIFTFGILLLTTAPVPRRLLVVPVIWSLIGGSAASLLHVPQDWLLLFSGLSVVPLLLAQRRKGGMTNTKAGITP